MQYSEIHPSVALAKYVKCYWMLSGEPDNYAAENVAPDGCAEMIINLEAPFRRYYQSGKTELQPTTFIVGQMRHSVVVQPTGRIDLLGVRFHPHGFFRFVDLPIDELTDRTLSCHDVWGSRIGELEERISDASTPSKRIGILERFLLNLIDSQRRPARTYETIGAAVRLLQSTRGLQSIEGLALTLGMSARHLERQFKSIVGLSPKSLGRIIRFQHALKLLRDGGFQSADIAIDCGYYDQPHFIHDFKIFSGQIPSAYCSEKYLIAHHFIPGDAVSEFYNT